MLRQVFRDVVPHRVEDDVHAFSASHLYGWNEIAVSRNEHDLVHKPLERDLHKVEAETHVHALLPDVEPHVVLGKLRKRLAGAGGQSLIPCRRAS